MASVLFGVKPFIEPVLKCDWKCYVQKLGTKLSNHQWVKIPPSIYWGLVMDTDPYSMVYGANMGPPWGRQVPGGPHVGPMNMTIAIWGYALVNMVNICPYKGLSHVRPYLGPRFVYYQLNSY